ncbi:MAG: hypothetical protein ACXAEN_20435 [Candidatus Thorarchaeota archaeon]|jgi:hypothetical protein
MAVINQREKWLFLCEPHTASRACSSALLQIDESREIAHHHATLAEITNPQKQGTTPLERLLGYDVVSVVRNPLDVLVTSWLASSNSRRDEWADFGEWLRFHIHGETVRNPLHRGLWQQCNIVCYYEHLQDDLNHVFDREVHLLYNTAHKTKRKQHWSNYYDKSLLDLVLLYYQSFLDHFGYEFTKNRREVVIDPVVRKRRSRKVGYGRYSS